MDRTWWTGWGLALGLAVGVASLVLTFLSYSGVLPLIGAEWMATLIVWICFVVLLTVGFRYHPGVTGLVSVVGIVTLIVYVTFWYEPSPPPYFTSTGANVLQNAKDDYSVAISVRNTNGMARDMVSQVVVTDQALVPRQDAILNDNPIPYRYAPPHGPQAELIFIASGLDTREITHPLFVAVFLQYTYGRNSQICTQSEYYTFPGLKQTGDLRWRLKLAQPEEQQQIETYLTKHDLLLFPLSTTDCMP